jgi:GNAT superfamily N-acetyltransferase
MIEIRTYDGDGRDLAELIDRAWRQTYTGQCWCPMWSEEYIRWHLAAGCANDRDFVVAAYVGGRLIGCSYSERATFRADGREIPATLGSWLTVDPEARSRRLAVEIFEELRRRHREYGAAFSLGYVNGNPKTTANRFWTAYAKLCPENLRFVRRIGYWVRVLNAASFRRKCLYRHERIAARAQGWLAFGGAPRGPAEGVRDYTPADLDGCARLVERWGENADLAMVWPRERLAAHLQWDDVPRTLVLERGGAVVGMVNFHRLGLLGKDVVSTGLVDLLVCEDDSAGDRRRLVRSAVARMASDGLDTAYTLRTNMFPARVMLACGFWPLPQSEFLTIAFPEPGLKFPPARRPMILFR